MFTYKKRVFSILKKGGILMNEKGDGDCYDIYLKKVSDKIKPVI